MLGGRAVPGEKRDGDRAETSVQDDRGETGQPEVPLARLEIRFGQPLPCVTGVPLFPFHRKKTATFLM